MPARDLYATLGVSRTADDEAIKKAYRQLAKTLHPDRAPGPANEQRFKEVNQAYEVLSDPARKGLYDEFGEASLAQGFDAERARMYRQYQQRGGSPGGHVDLQDLFGAQGGDLGDMLGDLFGRARGAGGAGGARRRRGQDLETSVSIDFVSAVKGTTLQVRPRGAVGEPVSVRIPPGAHEGSRVRIPGQGAPGAGGGPAGDLLLEIHVEPHPFFVREGDDLRLDVPIRPGEAFRGEKVRVPTPDGEVTLKVPPRTQSGQVTRLRGKGVARKGKEPGDLYVRFLVQLPVESTPEVEAALQALDERLEDPRRGLKF